MARRRGSFFTAEARPEDDLARERDLAALVQARRTVVQEIGVGRILPNPFQARQSFTDLEGLAESIRAHGFTTRLRVRPHPSQPNTFELVYGERRLRAAGIAGLDSVPCEIADHSDDDLVEIGLAENIQRRDLDPLEEARAFATFIEQRGYSVRRLAERIGKDKSYVESRLALLRMPDDVRDMVAQRPDSLRAAREIAKVDAPEARQPLISGVVGGALSTADVRDAVRDLTSPPADDGGPAEPSRPLGSSRERTVPDPLAAVRRGVDRDLQAIRAILGRWEQLIGQGEGERTAVDSAMGKLTAEMERVALLLLADGSA
ncbi:ParB/RepB/Spo0J family partition protein [Chloroflexales bacterium ZM16-3]|nr:ParB/RepB/Spo0J family partition protein [Chloroflexales bacterium ZM16-3]